MRQQIFVSSVQKEFAAERRALKDYIHGDPLLGRFFEVFLFEDVPAADRRADEVYLDQVARSDVYVGLFGREYGYEDKAGISPTQREYEHASALGKERLVYIKNVPDAQRHPKMAALATRAGAELVRRRFGSMPELTAQVYASLVDFLERSDLIRTGPFDGSACRNATIQDVSADKVRAFLRTARRVRDFALDEGTTLVDALAHLNLLDKGAPSHAAILLFGAAPQRFLISSEVKCMHFHGVAVRKPIPSYQIYKGTVFDMVDQAIDFVMSKLNRTVGTREHGPQAPVDYDIPEPAVAEAIVNAVAHRDYASNASVQVMLFADRLEVWNPGSLPPGLTLETLRHAHPSIPRNPLVAEPLFLTKYIEKAGSGILDMIEMCAEAGLPTPEFKLDAGCFVITLRRGRPSGTDEDGTKPGPSRDQVTVQTGTKSALSRHQVGILLNCLKESELRELMIIPGRSDRTKFRRQVLNPLLEQGLIEMTIPDKPRSSKQKYRITEKGRVWLNTLPEPGQTIP